MARRHEAGRLINVAVMAAIRRPLTYRVPDGLDVRPGHRVLVPLGSRRVPGIALERAARVAPGIELRDVLKVLDPEPLLSPERLTLGLWIADYYLAPVGEVFRAMLPLLPETRKVRVLRLTEKGRAQLEALRGDAAQVLSDEARLLDCVAAQADLPLAAARRQFPDLVPRALRRRWLTLAEVERERARRQQWSVRLGPAAHAATGATVHGPVPQRAPKLSPVARRILQALEEQGPVADHRALLSRTRATLAHLKKLGEAGLVELAPADSHLPDRPEEADRPPLEPVRRPPVDWQLTAAQSAVLEELGARLERREFAPVLLYGVTGSGKTEVYLRAIERCLELGRSALMLVPEIALTPGVEAQVIERFGGRVAVLHSALAQGARHRAWWRAWRGEARVVLGTRSALFAPLPDLGLIIVDEEHEASYKQEETPRYHGRDAAVVRARLARAVVLLGSATPSLESYWNAERGKYALARLPERVAGRPLAAVEIVDMRAEFRQTFSKIPISRRLQAEIETQLASGAQTMILLNRRGYSWFVLCRSCGQSERCLHCSISLAYHRREHRLLCHYCGYSTPVPARCRACQSEYLDYIGEGTEKIEDKLAELFPRARVARLDRDVARRPGQYQRLLADFRAGQIDILIGTQLISKGHDFPGVTLVGVVSADLALGLADFRAAERTFQLLTQVAGRAGRGDAPGRVLVQTFYPEHYAIRLAAEQNYEAFFTREMRFRRMMRYPPAAALANIIIQHPKLEQAARLAQQVGNFLESAIGSETDRFRVLGPGPAPLARIEGRYRIQFLIKAASRSELNRLLQRVADRSEAERLPPAALILDMDPVSVR